MKPGEHNDPADCICKRRAWCIGVKIMGRDQWVCLECAEMATEYGLVKRASFDYYEREAVLDAGNAAGAYLDSIDKTDLAALSELEYREFISRAVCGFGDSLRKQISQGKAPF